MIRHKLALRSLRCQPDLQRKKLCFKFKQMKNDKLLESDYWADDADGIAESTYCPSEYNKSSPFVDRPIPKYNLRSLKPNLSSLDQQEDQSLVEIKREPKKNSKFLAFKAPSDPTFL